MKKKLEKKWKKWKKIGKKPENFIDEQNSFNFSEQSEH
jgi:hypothetical protein